METRRTTEVLTKASVNPVCFQAGPTAHTLYLGELASLRHGNAAANGSAPIQSASENPRHGRERVKPFTAPAGL